MSRKTVSISAAEMPVSAFHQRHTESHFCNIAVDSATEGEATNRDAIIKYYQAVQQSNAVLQPSNATAKDRRTDAGEKYYSNGTPAERYWNNMGAENSNKRQNVSSLLQTIFPDGLAPLASKVAKIERREQARAAQQAAKQAAAIAAVSQPEEADAEVWAVRHAAVYVADHVTGIVTKKGNPALSTTTIDRTGAAAAPATPAARDHAALLQQRSSVASRLSIPASAAFGASLTGAGLAANNTGRRSDAASPVYGNGLLQHKHYSHGQKLAASIMWEAASGKSQSVRLRQCLTHDEIQMKNHACTEAAQSPLSRLDLQEVAFRVAQEV